MEHIINFAIDFDDKRIADIIEERAARDIINKIEDEVKKRFIDRYYSNDPLRQIVTDTCTEICREHEEEIVDRAVKLLAERLANRKIVKEKVGDLLESIED